MVVCPHDMKIIDETTGIERSETRTEILARHARMREDHSRSMDFLESIKRECFDVEAIELDALTEWNEYRADLADRGLVTLINRSTELMPVADIVERCSAILARHNGFKDGFHRVEDKTGYNRHLRLKAAGQQSDESDE